MIPLRDNVRARRFPLINISLILFTTGIFIYQETLPHAGLPNFIYKYGLIPARLFGTSGLFFTVNFFPLVSSIFLHGGWLHLIGNMLYLWVFGDNIEDRLGHLRYLIFYLAVGAISGLSHALSNPSSSAPTIGASGAVAGILGAYFISFPRARVLTLIPLGFFLTTVQAPAPVFLLLWFFLQLLNATMAAGMGAETVAWWAHIGGFISGIFLAILLPPFRSNR